MADLTKQNPENVYGVAKGEVLVSFEADPKFDSKGMPVADSNWENLGVLVDGGNVEINKSIEKSKTNGWGHSTVHVTTKPGEMTLTVETLENNATTRKIAWPTIKEDESLTIESGKASTLYHTPAISKAFVAVVAENDNGSKVIKVSRHKAYITMENVGFGQEVAGKTVNVDFVTGPNGDVFDELILEDGY